ncbi:VCBS repeat-containing protein [Streptomyces sp. RKAG290]|uniref:FG-GAP repeat domain-containing protein n=1 Tax=Streptomyces sp. RKAG290 TaxID=2888348 RepID=UPI0020341E3B|nr:VCBS repeat-containing protein [Streptomyces sp. RKAG290]MCM2413674.1 VCBS repeat-containing protein [Streptomyces sp. RKAG290]
MANTSGRRHRRTAARAAAAALTVALVATGTSAVAADSARPPAGTAADKPSAAASSTAAPGAVPPSYPLYGITEDAYLYSYEKRHGGRLAYRVFEGYTVTVSAITQVDLTADGERDGFWLRVGDKMRFQIADTQVSKEIGYGWDIYDLIVSVGNLGGADASDLLARDSKGDLYLYLGHENGTVTKRIKVGYGWDTYTELAGNGDLNGDGRNDIVARDKAGVLWLYTGTGNQNAPYDKRTRIGSGWNQYNRLVSIGDMDNDHRTDLLARDKAGALWMYAGTGDAASPYKPKVKIGTYGWNQYKWLF